MACFRNLAFACAALAIMLLSIGNDPAQVALASPYEDVTALNFELETTSAAEVLERIHGGLGQSKADSDVYVLLEKAMLTSERSQSRRGSLADRAASPLARPGPIKSLDPLRNISTGDIRPTLDERSTRLTADEPTIPSSWIAFDGADSEWNQVHPAIAVGSDHVVAAVNSSIDFWNRDGTLSDPGPPISFSSWFEDILETFPSELRLVEPQLLYDTFDERFVFSVEGRSADSNVSFILFSISASSDPTAGWCDYYVAPSYFDDTLYALPMVRHSMTVDNNQLVMAANLYQVNSESELTYDRSRAMYFAKDLFFGDSCVPTDDQLYAHGTALTADSGYNFLHAVTNIDDPAEIRFLGSNIESGDSALLLHTTTLADGSPGTVGGIRSQIIDFGESYRYPPDAEQPGTSRLVSTGFADISSAVIRNGRMAAVHNVDCLFEGGTSSRSCTNWFEVDIASGDIVKGKRFGAIEGYHSFPEIMLDECNRSLIVLNYSSSEQYPSVAYTDPEGTAFYLPPVGSGLGCIDNRPPSSAGWGFTNGIALDPVNGTIWGHAAYVGGESADCTLNDWKTLAFEIDWDRCDTLPEPTPTAVPPPTGGFAIGAPIAVNRDFRGEWLGPGRYTPRSGPLSSVAATGIIVQNLDRADSLDATSHFILQDTPYERVPSSPLVSRAVPVPRLGPGGIGVLYLPGLDLPRGTYSALVSVEEGRRVAGIVRTDWTDTGGAGLYRNVTPSDKLIVPLVVRNYYGQTSTISILSDDNTRPVDVEIAFFQAGSSVPVAVYVERDVRHFEGLTYDLNDNIPEFGALGDGFLGSATITMIDGAGNRRTDAKAGAVSHINIATSDLAISAFEAMPVGVEYSAAASTVYAPLWRSRQRGAGGAMLDTGISVVNPNDVPVDVDLTYFSTSDASASEACRAMEPRTITANIPEYSSHVFYQGPGGDPLPDNCFGSAIIESSGGDVLAIVNDSQNLIDIAAAYNAVPIQEAHTEVAVPMWRNHYTPALLTTGIQVMNVGDGTAAVHIDFLSTDGSLIPGCTRDCDVTIGPNESHTWWPPALASLPRGLVGGIGSALIESTEPIIAIVNDYPVAGGVDAATYNATPNFSTSGASSWD